MDQHSAMVPAWRVPIRKLTYENKSVKQFNIELHESALRRADRGWMKNEPGAHAMSLTKDVEVLSTIPLFAKVNPAKLKVSGVHQRKAGVSLGQ